MGDLLEVAEDNGAYIYVYENLLDDYTKDVEANNRWYKWRTKFRPIKAFNKANVTGIKAKTYNGKAQKQSGYKVTYSYNTLKEGTDFKVSYKNNVNAGTATMVLTGMGGYQGTKNVTFKINPASLAKASVAVANQTYTTKAVTPNPTVKLGSKTLKKGTDYTVSYKNNTKVGTATLTVKGKGNYTGSVSKTFKITKANISKMNISKVADQLYTGKALKPGVTIKNSGTTLKSGTDYTLSYKNNTKVGTAAITITGKGNYTGSATAKFAIKKTLPISMAAVTGVSNKAYTGKAITQSPTVKVNGTTLKNGTDYALSYKNNVNVGTATLTLTGKGKYTGTKAVTFKVTKAATKWERIWGNSQFDTMAKVAQKGWGRNSGGTVVIATGANFPDALSAAGVAGLFGAPVLLTNKKSLPAQTASELARIRPTRVIIAGGPGAVKTTVDAQIKAACGVAPTRCYGQTATDTAAKLATTYFKKRSSVAILATSRSFYDALAAAPVAYAKHYPIFLADNKDTLSRTTINAMKSCGIKQVIVVGGEKALTPRIVSTLKSNSISVKARLWGNDYYDTSRAIANWAVKNGMKADRVGVATSYSYYDALTGAALCGKNNAVLVLADDFSKTGKKNVDTGSLSFTKANKNAIICGYVFGGYKVVSEATLAACKKSTK